MTTSQKGARQFDLPPKKMSHFPAEKRYPFFRKNDQIFGQKNDSFWSRKGALSKNDYFSKSSIYPPTRDQKWPVSDQKWSSFKTRTEMAIAIAAEQNDHFLPDLARIGKSQERGERLRKNSTLPGSLK